MTGDTKEDFGYKRLIAWQKANSLAHQIYDLTLKFPRDEIYGLTSQLRRAALSVALNIVEGHARNSKKEFHRFLAISLGSLAETEYILSFAHERKYISDLDFKQVMLLRVSVGQLVWKLYLSQK